MRAPGERHDVHATGGGPARGVGGQRRQCVVGALHRLGAGAERVPAHHQHPAPGRLGKAGRRPYHRRVLGDRCGQQVEQPSSRVILLGHQNDGLPAGGLGAGVPGPLGPAAAPKLHPHSHLHLGSADALGGAGDGLGPDPAGPVARVSERCRSPSGSGARRRGFLQDDVGVGAADAEAAHPRRPAHPAGRFPGLGAGQDPQRRGGGGQGGDGRGVVDRPGQHAVEQGQAGPDQPDHTSGDVQVSEPALRGPQRHAAGAGVGGEHLGERPKFHLVAQGGAGAVRLDVADLPAVQARAGQRRSDGLRLSAPARRGEPV